MEEQRDEKLWQMAKKRASFQRSLATYFIINGFLWALWWFTAGQRGINRDIPWPIWSTLGWGIGIIFQYMNAYGGNRKELIEKEYDKLKNKNQ
jgi:hypothetical protein